MAKSAKTHRSGTSHRVTAAENLEKGGGSNRQTEVPETEYSENSGHASPDFVREAEKQENTEAVSPEISLLVEKKEIARSGFGYCRVLFAGIAGGSLALGASVFLQKTGIVPVMLPEQEHAVAFSVSRLEHDIAGLEDQLAKMASSQLAQPAGTYQHADMDNAGNTAREALDAVDLLRKELSGKADRKALGRMEETVRPVLGTLEHRLEEIDILKRDIAVALSRIKSQEDQLEVFKKDLSVLSEKEHDPDAEMMFLVAANALKTAVDRGGSYRDALLIFEAVAPEDPSIDLLRQYADKGLPSAGELSQRFSGVADSIARAKNHVSGDAGIGKRLWAAAQSLISVRPTGNAEGNSPGAAAARMEGAIAAGDYARAIEEWKGLPDTAKTVSADFMTVLEARYEVDTLFSHLLAKTLSPLLPRE